MGTVSKSFTRIAVFASGTGSNLEALFEALGDRDDAAIVLVVSDRSGAKALDRARRRDVEAAVIDPGDARAMVTLLEDRDVDWIVLAGYLKRVPTDVVARWRNRILNVHPALLPRFGGKGMYGRHVHRAVLEAGETVSGATVHLVDEEYDRGPIVAQRQVPVEPDDTAESLAERVLEVEHRLLPEVVIAAAEGRIEVDDSRARIVAAAR